ncbi:head-tail adaptor Ad1 [Dinoroseobacter phage vB_DshS-R5C]|uniref:Putative minor tail protein n=1 Tax=Dinoroseobacter phage vB_DshS-R5C TaxID=1965368 RepID=A0A1V0DYA2_9CAUD|nr:head-tail adaptor Ad1 [Dinoroseobacter phage vB_DshS-R5C]ARB06110.1 putative minor tail protein [Dinoroseobacter phage vB_DshS-R5C]
MTLTVGTDAYDTLANVRAYWAARDATASAAWIALADADAELLIRKATDYVDRNFSYIGDKATAAQRLKWPRKFAEVEGFLLDSATIPWQVQEATAIIAELYRLGTFDMEGIITDDAAAISMQKVDVITVQYDTTKRLQGKDVPSHVYALLRPLTLGTGGLKRA